MTHSPSAPLTSWLVEPLDDAIKKSVERVRRQEDVAHVALMPDVHLAKGVCVGAVVATNRLIYPAAVGSDIGCGMAALAFDADASLVDNQRSAAQFLAGLYESVPSNRQAKRRDLPVHLRTLPLSSTRLENRSQRDGRVQMGTLGRGNHFFELQADQEGRLWTMVHSGSRGMGQAITRHHVASRIAIEGRSSLIALDADTEAGQAYLADLEWARQYARESRLAMLRAAESLLERLFQIRANWSTLVHCDHNHVQRENHAGRQLWVHRKGAQAAGEGEPGIVPGSMGTESFHVLGRGCAESLLSCSHGAGRRFSRGAAARRLSTRTLSREMKGIWFDQRLAHRLLDEAPSAYKDVKAVMRAQRELVKTVCKLAPVLSYKAS